MPNYALAMLRPSSAAAWARSHLRSVRRALSKFARPQSFACPPTLSAVPARLRRNLAAFKIHYAVLLWASLLLFLAPAHKPTMLFLMAASKVALFYEVLLKAIPSSWRLLRRVLDRRLAMGAFLGIVLVELAVSGALGRLGLALGLGAPVVGMHAVFFKVVGDDVGSSGDTDSGKEGADADPVGAEKEKKDDADLESGAAAR